MYNWFFGPTLNEFSEPQKTTETKKKYQPNQINPKKHTHTNQIKPTTTTPTDDKPSAFGSGFGTGFGGTSCEELPERCDESRGKWAY